MSFNDGTYIIIRLLFLKARTPPIPRIMRPAFHVQCKGDHVFTLHCKGDMEIVQSTKLQFLLYLLFCMFYEFPWRVNSHVTTLSTKGSATASLFLECSEVPAINLHWSNFDDMSKLHGIKSLSVYSLKNESVVSLNSARAYTMAGRPQSKKGGGSTLIGQCLLYTTCRHNIYLHPYSSNI